MRILVISNYYPPLELGGWEQLTRDVTGLLAARGHQTYVLTSNYQAGQIKQPEPDVARVLHLESPDHQHYHPHYTLFHRRQERQNRQYLAQTVKKFGPDVIFINGMWNLPLSLAREAERLLPGCVVYYVASYWPTEPDAHSAYWQSPAGRGWVKLLKQGAGFLARKTLISGLPRNQLAFTRVLCVSAFMQNHLVEVGHIPRCRTRVVHNGIDPAEFPMRNLQNHSATVRLLYAGRLSPDKGVHTAIEALGHLLTTNPQAPVTLSVVGSGAPDYEARLKQQVETLKLGRVVQFRGQVPREQMPAILQEHEVLLLPSIWAEPLARMTQEAMACGLVVIGTLTGGTPEILHDGQNGLTFEAGNAVMLAGKIGQVAADRAWRIQLATAARQTIEQHFTMKRMVDEIEQALTSVHQSQAELC